MERARRGSKGILEIVQSVSEMEIEEREEEEGLLVQDHRDMGYRETEGHWQIE